MKEKDIEKERENRVSLSCRGIMHPANATRIVSRPSSDFLFLFFLEFYRSTPDVRISVNFDFKSVTVIREKDHIEV